MAITDETNTSLTLLELRQSYRRETPLGLRRVQDERSSKFPHNLAVKLTGTRCEREGAGSNSIAVQL